MDIESIYKQITAPSDFAELTETELSELHELHVTLYKALQDVHKFYAAHNFF